MKSDPCNAPLSQHRTWPIILIAIGLILFALLTYAVVTESIFYALDNSALDLFRRWNETAPVWLARVLTVIGNVGSQGTTIFVGLLAFLWLVQREWRKFLLIVVSVIGMELSWLGMIYLFGRTRPTEVTSAVGSFSLPSFPSGHVWIVIVFYGLLLYVYWDWLVARRLQVWATLAVISFALLNGVSRLFYLAHYLSDIVAAIAIGLAWALGVPMLLDWYLCRRQKEPS
ncbi:MAG TPA: phosphatase PAP2 family protein [Candidatus Binatia bacterium]|jgi:undecaprenyl-diphosphatase|nr:phosphatase PAP2 family protein [Candidatus Binatia bacterium]